MSHKDLIVFQDLIRLPFFISENEHINTLFQIFQKQKIHLAVAQDEFGGTAGIVTLEDIIEEVFGEIQDEYDEELPIVEKKSDFEFIVRASANISDVNDHLPLPLPESDEYETVAGLVTHTVGYIPEVNAEINLENYSCKILKRTKRKIDLVRLVVTENRDMD